MADTHSRTYRRREDQSVWHWRTDCAIYKAAAGMKKRGKVFIYLTIPNVTINLIYPTTYQCCSGCRALDERIRTRCYPYNPPPPWRPFSLPLSWATWVH